MQTVEVRIAAAELPTQMATMRNWLNEHRFEPSSFACIETAAAIAVSVAFADAGAAMAFAERFAGRLRARPEIPLERATLSPSGMVG